MKLWVYCASKVKSIKGKTPIFSLHFYEWTKKSFNLKLKMIEL
jgi:hypothetical protein